MTDTTVRDCVVVGAGISGLLAASRLQEAGLRVTLLEKSRGVGGRMATRRTDDAVFDHGAQFFTVRDERFAREVDRWKDLGAVVEWCRGFPDRTDASRPDGHPRFRGKTGMTSVAKHLAGSLDVRIRERVSRLGTGDGTWTLETDRGATFRARSVLMTAPVPQSLALLTDSGLSLPDPIGSDLAGIEYWPCIAVLLSLAEPAGWPDPGAWQPRGEPIGWLADNQAKGISTTPSVTVHGGPLFSETFFDRSDTEVMQGLAPALDRWLDAPVASYQVHRWRYCEPKEVRPETCVATQVDSLPLVFAGDAFGSARVEGAALSGLEASRVLIEDLG